MALLTPFTNKIFLPALSSVKSDLHASSVAVSVPVSAYLAACEVGQLSLAPPPVDDYFGRRQICFTGLCNAGTFYDRVHFQGQHQYVYYVT